MDYDDFIQSGFLGAVSVVFQKNDTSEELIARQVTAARREMIDAMRSFGSYRYSNGKQREVIVFDIVEYSNRHAVPNVHENTHIQREDFLRLAMSLKRQEREILWERLHGYTLLEIAEKLSLTEGRLSQIQAEIIKRLRAGLSK